MDAFLSSPWWVALDHHTRRRALACVLSALARQTSGSDRPHAVTVAEVASWARYSKRWTAVALARLESLGLIVWERGGVRDGAPTRGTIWLDLDRLRALTDLPEPSEPAC